MSSDEQSKPSFGMERQLAIYVGGTRGQRPEQPPRIEELRERAREKLKPVAWDYLEGGAGAEETMRGNTEAFRRWQIVPRMLRGVDRPDRSIELFGQRLAAPVLLAPIGVQSILHPEAELAAARAAASIEIPFVLSTASSKSIEEVATTGGQRWFQLYWSRNDELTASFLARAEKAGYSAIVVTLDTLQMGWRPRDLANGYLPFLYGNGLANYFTDPVFRAALPAPPEQDPAAAVRLFAAWFSDPALTWERLGFLRQHTRLPVLLKGILHPDDARRAIDEGMNGVIVSNHGGRQVDGAIGALDALPWVVEAVAGRAPVLFDSGIRQGADVFKALALGARAILLGRPYGYGLAVRGEAGVRDVLLDLLAELDLTLALAGCPGTSAVTPECLIRVQP